MHVDDNRDASLTAVQNLQITYGKHYPLTDRVRTRQRQELYWTLASFVKGT